MIFNPYAFLIDEVSLLLSFTFRFNMEINHFFLKKCANPSDFILQTSLISQGLAESSVQSMSIH